jgi:eukaryotic-like serine/threonine-protein kinase
MRGAVDAMRRAVALLPKHVTYRTNLAVLYDYAGDFQAAENEVRGIESPDEAALLALAFSQVGQEQLPAAADTYRRLGALGDIGRSFQASGLGDLAVYQGRFGEAVALLQQGVAADLAGGNPDGAARKLTSIAYAELGRGKSKAALAAARSAASRSRAVDVRVLAATALLDAGDEAGAKVLADDLELELTPEPQAYGKLLQGAIYLKQGDGRRAIHALTESSGMLDTWLVHYYLGLAYLHEGVYLQADAEFDRCIKRRGEVLSLFDEDVTFGRFPIVYYYQGRVREALKTASFADAYRAYLAVRGDSIDDPLVADARRRGGS